MKPVKYLGFWLFPNFPHNMTIRNSHELKHVTLFVRFTKILSQLFEKIFLLLSSDLRD